MLTPATEGVGDFDPKWSPDGRRIVFSREPASDPAQIVVINADGSKERRFAEWGFRPNWRVRPPRGRPFGLVSE